MWKEDKGFYDRKVVYLDYLERGEKVKNAGVIRWDAQGNESRIRIHIRGLYATDTLQGEIQLVSRGENYSADRIGLKYGTGEYSAVWKNDALAGTTVSYDECDGILIRLSENRLLKGQWREREPIVQEKATPSEEVEAQEVVSEPVVVEPEMVAVSPEPVPVVSEPVDVSPIELADAPLPVAQESGGLLNEPAIMPPVGFPNLPKTIHNKIEQMQHQEVLSPNKWEQLEKTYPKIHPFGDDRECLSITPRDFIVLGKKYQGLVQNSFLLHGYYNYGHVVLVKIAEKENDDYYLGVPGVYFDREKQAALMFGFEGFEGGKEKVADGSFGYYMKRVEI